MKKNDGERRSSRRPTADAAFRLKPEATHRPADRGRREVSSGRQTRFQAGFPTRGCRVAIDQSANVRGMCRGVRRGRAPGSDAPALQPHRRHRDARSARLDLSARRAGHLPHRRGPRWPPGGGHGSEVWRGTGDAAASDRDDRHRRRDATDRGRRDHEGSWLPAPRRHRRHRRPHLSRRRHRRLRAGTDSADAGESAGLRQLLGG